GAVLVQAQGPPVYVSNYNGHQILKVDGTTGSVSGVYTDPEGTMLPEGIAVGPDGKIWICDSVNSRILQINQDGTDPQVVFTGGSDYPPEGAEGPSFDPAGDLFLNTRDDVGDGPTGVWYINAAVTFSPTATHAPAVGNLLPTTDANVGAFYGEGTALDLDGNLLVVDRSGNRVLRSSPPFNPTSSTADVLINTDLDEPIGIAVDSHGDIFVANNASHNIYRFDSSGNPLGVYYSFMQEDFPYYMQFDSSDRLYVVTEDSTEIGGGKVWRIDPVGTPPTSGSATLLADLSSLSGSGAVPGLNGTAAVGVAVPEISAPPQAFYEGQANTETFNFASVTHQLQFPSDAVPPSACYPPSPCMVRATAIPVTPTDFSAMRLAGTAFSNAQCVAIPSPDPNFPPSPCIAIRDTCYDSNLTQMACPTTNGFDSSAGVPHNSDDIVVTTSITLPAVQVPGVQLPAVQFPGFLTATEGLNDWVNVFTSFSSVAPTDTTTGSLTFTGGLGAIHSDFVPVDFGKFAANGTCGGSAGHQILPPISADGSSVFKAGRTVPAKFRVCFPNDASTSVGQPTVPTVVKRFSLVQVIAGTTTSDVTNTVDSSNPDTSFRWDPNGQQWIFNISTKDSTIYQPDHTYVYQIVLTDGSVINFQFGLR
ncbi:MAG: PxKF domain-containing protein, partial [Acidobacteriota bacterium]